jgi:predicted metal-dependent enzyme (double-stranded beta helix superfamily)
MGGADQQILHRSSPGGLDPRLCGLCETARCLSTEPDHQLLTRELAEHLRAVGIRLAHLPSWALEPRADRYARHRLHLCPDTGLVLLAMVWQAGQGSPVHDHGGAWGVMSCLAGRLSVIDYSRHDDPVAGTVDLRVLRSMLLEPGQIATTWAPDRAIHRIHNHGPHTAVSLHLYSREITTFSVFDPAERAVEQVSFAS